MSEDISFNNLRTLRNKRIAHHDIGELPADKVAQIGDEKRLLDATGKIVKRLGDLVGIDPNFEPMRRTAWMSARLFWAPVRAETRDERIDIQSKVRQGLDS